MRYWKQGGTGMATGKILRGPLQQEHNMPAWGRLGRDSRCYTLFSDPIRLARMVNKVEWLEWRTKTDTTPSSLPGWGLGLSAFVVSVRTFFTIQQAVCRFSRKRSSAPAGLAPAERRIDHYGPALKHCSPFFSSFPPSQSNHWVPGERRKRGKNGESGARSAISSCQSSAPLGQAQRGRDKSTDRKLDGVAQRLGYNNEARP